jgi:hypothetical protein
MIENKAKIKSGAPKRNPVCYQTLQDIVIPAGTILRWQGGDNYGCGAEEGKFWVNGDDAHNSAHFKKVIA